MGKAYRISGDEKYAKEWVHQYMDWVQKNPLVNMKQEEFELVSAGEVKEDADNVYLHGGNWKSATVCRTRPASFFCFAPHRRLLRSS